MSPTILNDTGGSEALVDVQQCPLNTRHATLLLRPNCRFAVPARMGTMQFKAVEPPFRASRGRRRWGDRR